MLLSLVALHLPQVSAGLRRGDAHPDTAEEGCALHDGRLSWRNCIWGDLGRAGKHQPALSGGSHASLDTPGPGKWGADLYCTGCGSDERAFAVLKPTVVLPVHAAGGEHRGSAAEK